MRLRSLLVAVLLTGGSMSPAAASYTEGPNRPCRFQYREADNSWSKLVGRGRIRTVLAAYPSTEVRKASNAHSMLWRYTTCLAHRYDISARKAKSVLRCEGAPDDNPWQFIPPTWRSSRRTYGHPHADEGDTYESTRVAVKKRKAEGSWAESWTCGARLGY